MIAPLQERVEQPGPEATHCFLVLLSREDFVRGYDLLGMGMPFHLSPGKDPVRGIFLTTDSLSPASTPCHLAHTAFAPM